MRRWRPCPPTPACTSTSAPRAALCYGRNPVTAVSFARTDQLGARLDRPKGLDAAHGQSTILQSRMKFSVVRFVAVVLLSGQMLPAGLPLLCKQAQRATAANCEQQMPSHQSGPAVDVATNATPCANSALCATAATAVVTLGVPASASARESHFVGYGISTFAPADPQPPLPPPPQA